ncbi:hypothetical protein COU74_01860 [Candidatus Peregrinibacteria bacterium CG10_big_fil_rev_8_21_14_0_10_36_19]|nr:MAG: hypothetical protein COU74_01860 [Candidatus Peregrinibacteria bacterium CG10_big_fil_rev_8_21_14_0_10_36_19]
MSLHQPDDFAERLPTREQLVRDIDQTTSKIRIKAALDNNTIPEVSEIVLLSDTAIELNELKALLESQRAILESFYTKPEPTEHEILRNDIKAAFQRNTPIDIKAINNLLPQACEETTCILHSNFDPHKDSLNKIVTDKLIQTFTYGGVRIFIDEKEVTPSNLTSTLAGLTNTAKEFKYIIVTQHGVQWMSIKVEQAGDKTWITENPLILSLR